MAYQALDEATRASITAQAKQRAAASGRTAEQELYDYAQTQGISNSGIDTMMGLQSGATQSFANNMQSQGGSNNLGLGQFGGAPTQDDRVSIIGQANDRAIQSGGSVTDEMVKYANSIGMPLNVAEQRMGYAAGTLSGGPAASVASSGGSALTAASTGGSANIEPAGLGGSQTTSQPSMSLGSGFGGPQSPQSNPYLRQMGAGITEQMNDNWTRNLAPSIRSGAMAAGGFGGSRQGVVEANGLNDMNRSLGQNLTNLYGQNYEQQMGRNLQQYQSDQQFNLGLGSNANQSRSIGNQLSLGSRGLDVNERIANQSNNTANRSLDNQFNLGSRSLDNQFNISSRGLDNQFNLGSRGLEQQSTGQQQSYDLGLRSSDLGFAGLDSNINQNNFNNQMAGANFGLNAYNTLQSGNNLGLNAATTIQNTPMNYQGYFNNSANATGGLGGQTSETGPSQQGSALTGAMGGYQLASAFNNSRPKNSAGNNPYSGGNAYSQYGNGAGSYLSGFGGSGD